MVQVLYNRYLNFTSVLLNFCVRHHMWWCANRINEHRKKHIIVTLRKLVCPFTRFSE
jgi:hypothetical protein